MKITYVANLIGLDYFDWANNKIIIQAPTGSGKSTFVVDVLLRHYRRRGVKLLILCNRRLLRLQYWYQLVSQFDSYDELKEAVEVKTYQELASVLMSGGSAESLFNGYAGIVLDECHYFYSDADFNGFGTYVLVQALIKAGLERQMVFMTATIECIEPWIRRAINHYKMSVPMDEKWERLEKNCLTIKKYEFPVSERYSYVKCYAVKDIESLAEIFGKSEHKGLIFMDNKKKAEELSMHLQKRGGLNRNDIASLNAENLENGENTSVVKALAMANRVEPHVILTTSVLDNGVSVRDPEVQNVAIITESKVSFLQMLGRVRCESTSNLKLYFLIRDAEEFAKREHELEHLMGFFDVKSIHTLYKNRSEIMNTVWNNSSELADVFRKVYVLEPEGIDVLQEKSTIHLSYGDMLLAVNLLAKAKLGDLYLTEAKFHNLAIVNPLNVIYEQMGWLEKSSEELQILSSTFAEEQEKILIERLSSVKNFSCEELGPFKEKIANDFGKTILKTYELRSRPFSKKIFKEILKQYDLALLETKVNGRNSYSVERIITSEEV